MSHAYHKRSHDHGSWQIQEAKAHFSQLINSLESNGMQRITKQGKEVAIILSKAEYEKLVRPKTSLIEFFENSPLSEIDIDFPRSKDEMRDFEL